MSHHTIVLGAGASAQFGFPLGNNLYTDIMKRSVALKSFADNPKNHGLPGSSGNNSYFFAKNRDTALASYLVSALARQHIPEEFSTQNLVQKIVDFGDILQRSTHVSVDRFIGDNPSLNFIGKVLLCQEVLLKMFDFKGDSYWAQNFTARQMNGRRNWYHLLINHIRDRHPAKLYIVTFNYDMSLEMVLGKCLNATERHRNTDYSKSLEIIHVNGSPVEVPDNLTDVGAYLLNSAKQLHLVDEEVDSEFEKMRKKVRKIISSSERIYIMGFHFDPSNVTAIGLGDAPEKSRVFCLNFDSHLGVQNRIRNLGISEYNIWSKPGYEWHIDEALDKGFLLQ